MEIKICGITNLDDVSYLNQVKVDYGGFVFYEKSKRNLTIEQAKTLMNELNEDIAKVAVMVSPEARDIIEKQEAGFDILQIHGQLSDFALMAAGVPIWYAVNIDNEEELRLAEENINQLPKELSNKIQGIVIDSKHFGSGQTFNWDSIRQSRGNIQSSLNIDILANRKFILAGGLNASNVRDAIDSFHPHIVDVSSGVEASKEMPGKDLEKIKEFVNATRRWQN